MKHREVVVDAAGLDRDPANIDVPAKTFRTDIEGLRAIAALLVAVYHIWLGRVSGGVDVFFVIAGFLIAGTLLRRLQRTGRVGVGGYLGRLMVRLLPNALTVLLAVGIATVALFPVTRQQDVMREIVASALYVENWQLIANSVDYLARDAGDSPVQHFWAMSIQGQFYLIWLALALVAVFGARRAIGRRFLVVVALVTAGSFIASVVMTLSDQPVAYFHTAARAWEFGVGALVALTMSAVPWRAVPRLGRRGQWVTGWLGLLLIVTTGMLMPVGSAFPGVAALVPVAGAVLILLSGTRSRGSAAAVLSSRPLVSLGGVAYALYLWHWPVLVFYLHLRGVDHAGLGGGAVVLVTSIVLAYASTTLIERPIRSLNWERPGTWTAPIVGVTATAVLLGPAVAVSASLTPTMPVGDDIPLAHWAEPGASADFTIPPSESPYPGIAAAAKDRPTMWLDGCNQKVREPAVLSCVYGDPDAERTMLLVGGSHSVHFQPALHEIAVQLGWRLETRTKSGCRQGISMVGPEFKLYDDPAIVDSCNAWDEEVTRMLLADPPELVVAVTTAVSREGEWMPPYYEEFWRLMDEHDITMLGIRGTPRAPTNRVECVAEHGPGATECDFPREEALQQVNPAAALAEELPGLTVADLTPWICSETNCPPIVEDTFIYHDRHHLTASFSRALAQPLFRAVPQVFE